MLGKKYIHYGHTEFRRDLFSPIRNRVAFSKPFGGLWASSVDAEYGWKDWCKDNDFNTDRLGCSFEFALSDDANILHIYNTEQLQFLPNCKLPFPCSWCCPDFEQLLAKGYDAIELHLSEENSKNKGLFEGLYWDLYGWDCDSILIMNPEVVVCEI